MKNLSFLLAFIFLLSTQLIAQVPPNAFNYSAVARNAAGQPIASTTIGIQISILKTSPTGATQYSETHFVDTDSHGLFKLAIGEGNVQSGTMATIDWSSDNYYLKVGMDAAGGSNFLSLGTTQFLSVPYAFYADITSAMSVGSGSGNFLHYIGEEFGGGIIFYLWKDTLGVEHGLIVDKVDLSLNQVWSNQTQTIIGPSAQSLWDGMSNSIAIVSEPGHTNSAAALCLNSSNGGQNDWYLPSVDELLLIFRNRFDINKTLSTISGATQVITFNGNGGYWSSTEANIVWGINNSFYTAKNTSGSVRAVRAF